ncbi:MAG: hypothetical protein JRI59_03130 [Deltaproteobacteria bacterium]|nr:hypothetical protein [Deltaproteobacteria bacterium]MBW1991117.1 hypothetical protein [Deltaproteobacteria bacterium]
MTRIKPFWREDSGSILATEYMIFLAAIVILLAAGIWALQGGLSDLFAAYSQYFQPPQ